jgi:hypothetical protein
MRNQPPRPWELKVLIALFVVWSGLRIWENVHRWGWASALGEVYTWDASVPGESEGIGHGQNVDWVIFALLAALGLWRYWPAGRFFALCLTWCWWIGSALLIPQVFHLRVGLRSGEPILPEVPEAFLRWAVGPFFLLQLWQYLTLRRPDIKALFYPPVRVKLRGMDGETSGKPCPDSVPPVH